MSTDAHNVPSPPPGHPDSDDNRFIPVRFAELVDDLADYVARETPDAAVRRDTFRELAGALHEVIVQEASAFARYLAEAYAPFNPDRDTVTRRPLSDEQRQAARRRLVPALTYLFNKANFELITDEEFEAAVEEANSRGMRLRIDHDSVDDQHLCCRGRGTIKRKVRSWRTRFRLREVDLPVYTRFAVVIKLREEPWIYIKLFKNIPRMDIEALLPHARIEMTLVDRIKLFGGGAGAISGSVYKLFGALGKVVVAWTNILWILLVAAVLLIVRTVTGYRHIRTHRDAERTRNLYFQNLDNNAGVIHALVAMVCEEEAKEALLAYAVCLRGDPAPKDSAELDAHIEAHLRDQYDVRADFEIADAMETLQRLRMWEQRATLQVVTPEEVQRRLEEHWCERRSLSHHLEQALAGGSEGPKS